MALPVVFNKQINELKIPPFPFMNKPIPNFSTKRFQEKGSSLLLTLSNACGFKCSLVQGESAGS